MNRWKFTELHHGYNSPDGHLVHRVGQRPYSICGILIPSDRLDDDPNLQVTCIQCYLGPPPDPTLLPEVAGATPTEGSSRTRQASSTSASRTRTPATAGRSPIGRRTSRSTAKKTAGTSAKSARSRRAGVGSPRA